MKKWWWVSLILVPIVFFLIVIINYPIKYRASVLKYSEMYGLQPEVVASVIMAESGFNRRAISGANAKGLMQLRVATADEVAGKVGLDEYDIFDADTNIMLGCYYLRYLMNYYDNDLTKALCAYNAGMNTIKSWDFDNIPFDETANYVEKILKNKKVYKLLYFTV